MQNIQKGSASLFHSSGKPYTSISNEAVDALTNPDALAIWTYLQTRDSGWTVIGGYLQERFGMGRERYAKAMRFLKEAGLVSHEAVKCDTTNTFLGRRVIVHHSPNLRITEPTDSRTFGKSTTTNKGSITNKGIQPTGDKSPITEEAFEVFWSAGMRKLNKKGALKAFQAACKRLKADPQEFAQKLADDVRARVKSGQLGFDAMHPTTYLNNERWEDEVLKPVEKPAFSADSDRWWTSDAGIQRKAAQEGVYSRPGESYRDLADRIRVMESKGVLRSQQPKQEPVEDLFNDNDIPY